MTDGKQPEARTAKAGSLLSQWWTMGGIALDKRTAGRHMTVAWVLIDRYMQKRGNARASLSYIETATSLSRPTVIGACRELVEWGYFTRHLGAGTRPTEYSPNWLEVNPSLPLASGQQGFTSCGQDGFTSSAASGEQGFTQNLLTSPADKPADSIVGTDTHAAAPADGLAATAARARDPFEEFWDSYPRKHQRSKAEAAWAKLAPDEELAAVIVDGARRLSTHYADNPVDKKWMKQPANWLAGKGWTEDLPEIYVDAKQAAIAKKVSGPKPEIVSAPTPPKAEETKEPFKPWRKVARILSAATTTQDDGAWLEVVLECDNGELIEESVWLAGDNMESDSEGFAAKEQQRAWEIYSAANVPHYADPSKLIGASVEIAQFSEYSREQYYPLHECRGPRIPDGGFRAIVEKHPLNTVHPNSFAAAFANDDEPDEQDKFDMGGFITRAKRITGEAA